jgi:hypothetical protein
LIAKRIDCESIVSLNQTLIIQNAQKIFNLSIELPFPKYLVSEILQFLFPNKATLLIMFKSIISDSIAFIIFSERILLLF